VKGRHLLGLIFAVRGSLGMNFERVVRIWLRAAERSKGWNFCGFAGGSGGTSGRKRGGGSLAVMVNGGTNRIWRSTVTALFKGM